MKKEITIKYILDEKEAKLVKKKMECICKFEPKIEDGNGKCTVAIYTPNYNCPSCFPEQNCEKHLWKSSGINKGKIIIFCENCGKIKTLKL